MEATVFFSRCHSIIVMLLLTLNTVDIHVPERDELFTLPDWSY